MPELRKIWALRVAQSTSRRTFDNAFRGLEPRCQPVGPRFVPAVGNRSESPLVALTLETEPSAAVFARDFHVTPKWVLASLRGAPPVGKTGELVTPGATARRAAIHAAPLGRRRRHQPDFPPFTARIHKGPVTQAASSRASPTTNSRPIRAQVRADVIWICRPGAKKLLTVTSSEFFFVGNVRIRPPDRSRLIEFSLIDHR